MGVGDPGDGQLVDRRRVEAGDLLGDEDALRRSRGGPAAGRARCRRRRRRPSTLVRQRSSVTHEAAVHGDALLLVAEALGDRAAADGDQQQLGLDHVAALDGDGDAVVGRP